MAIRDLTYAKMLVLGRVAEMRRHGYQLEQAIARRAMRQRTQIGVSTNYFVLGQLEKMRLVAASKTANTKACTGARNTCTVTKAGRRVLVVQSIEGLQAE